MSRRLSHQFWGLCGFSLTSIVLATAATAQEAPPDARLERLRETCAGYGFQIGTDSFAQCVQAADIQQRQARERQWRATQCLLRVPGYCEGKTTPATLPLVPPVMTTCTRDNLGGLHCISQ